MSHAEATIVSTVLLTHDVESIMLQMDAKVVHLWLHLVFLIVIYQLNSLWTERTCMKSRPPLRGSATSENEFNFTVSIPHFLNNFHLAPLPRRLINRSNRNRPWEESLSSLSTRNETSHTIMLCTTNSNPTFRSSELNCTTINHQFRCTGARVNVKDRPFPLTRAMTVLNNTQTPHKHQRNPNVHVSFALQNNSNNVEPATTSSASSDHRMNTTMSANVSAHQSAHDMATDTVAKPPRATINPLAEPMWLAARKHAIAEQKTTLQQR